MPATSRPTRVGSIKPLRKVENPTRDELLRLALKCLTQPEPADLKRMGAVAFTWLYPSAGIYENGCYQVLETRHDCPPNMVHLAVSRVDNEPIRSWSDMQEIKNQICGPECEGVELFPARSRLIDLSNSYHLWVLTNTEECFPFGPAKKSALYSFDSSRQKQKRKVKANG